MEANVCIPNIGPEQRRIRLVSGLVGYGIVLLAGAGLLLGGAPRVWRLLLIFPLLLGQLGVQQAREKT